MTLTRRKLLSTLSAAASLLVKLVGSRHHSLDAGVVKVAAPEPLTGITMAEIEDVVAMYAKSARISLHGPEFQDRFGDPSQFEFSPVPQEEA